MVEELLEPAQVAQILGVTTERVRQLALTGVLFPVASTKRSRFYSRENVEAVAAARRAGDEIRERLEITGQPAGELADHVEKQQLRKIARDNFRRADTRARERLTAMQRRLEQLNLERAPVAAELEAIDAERQYLVAVIERLAAELGPKGH